MLAFRRAATNLVQLRNGGARTMTRAVGPDEWWAVDGEILRIRPQVCGGYKRVNMEAIDLRPKPVTVKKRLSDRIQRLEQIRIRDNTQELYWDAYMKRFNDTREEWEELYWDGIPMEPLIEAAKRPVDHYLVLGLRKRHHPYSPLELKAAFRDKAMVFHPENNREKDSKKRAANMAKFRQVWESYKNLQNKRSW